LTEIEKHRIEWFNAHPPVDCGAVGVAAITVVHIAEYQCAQSIHGAVNDAIRIVPGKHN
jgi:hypothetical protein